jgi:phosphoribosyl-ATP pyrophosphohydrolase
MTDSVDRLYAAVLAARSRDPAFSRTAKLLGEGMPKMAKKVAEEAVEVGLEAVQGDRSRTILESADLVYNLVVLWSEIGISPDDVYLRVAKPAQSGYLRAIGSKRGALRARHAPVAQLDRASDYESEGQRFESFRARHSAFGSVQQTSQSRLIAL